MLVTGGYGWEGYLASTEVFSSGAWRTTGALPGPVCYMSAVNIRGSSLSEDITRILDPGFWNLIQIQMSGDTEDF